MKGEKMKRLIDEYNNFFVARTKATKEDIITRLNIMSIESITNFILYLKNKYKIVDVLISNGHVEFISLLKK